MCVRVCVGGGVKCVRVGEKVPEINYILLCYNDCFSISNTLKKYLNSTQYTQNSSYYDCYSHKAVCTTYYYEPQN